MVTNLSGGDVMVTWGGVVSSVTCAVDPDAPSRRAGGGGDEIRAFGEWNRHTEVAVYDSRSNGIDRHRRWVSTVPVTVVGLMLK